MTASTKMNIATTSAGQVEIGNLTNSLLISSLVRRDVNMARLFRLPRPC